MLLPFLDQLIYGTPKPKEDVSEASIFKIEVKGETVPVRIRYETRPNNRVTINSKGILIRISKRQRKEEQQKSVESFLKWAREKLEEKPDLIESIPLRKYTNGEILQVGEFLFEIAILQHEFAKSSAKITENRIVIQLAKGLNAEVEGQTCSYLIAKCLCKFFHPLVSSRIHELNDRYFKKEVKHIKMKYATSFWGHCSRQGNIVISLRLMFAPPAVVDYVLIHELAHLVHHNHSARYWNLVEQVMPDYLKAEKHLKEFSHKYYL